MLTPIRLFLGNVMSHKATLIEYQAGVPVLIEGRNLFDKGQKRNGTGKSVILEGLSLAMTGTLLRDVPIKEVVRDGEDSAVIQFDLYDSTEKKMVSIHREFFAKKSKSATIQILVNGVPRDITSVNHGNDIVLELLGLEKDDLYNYFIISKFKYEPFLSATDGTKKRIIGRFSQADRLDGVIDAVKQEITHAERDKQESLQTKTTLEGKVEVYQKLIDESDTKAAQKKIDDQIAVNKKTRKEVEKEKEGYITLHKTKSQELTLKDIEVEEAQKKFDEIEKEIEEIGKRIDSHRVKIDQKGDLKIAAGKEKGKLELQLADEVECPECEHHFSVKDPQLQIVTVEKQILDYSLKIAEYEKDIEALRTEGKDDQESYTKKGKELEAQRKIKQTKTSEADVLERDVLQLERDQKACDADIEALDLELKGLEAKEVEDQTQAHQKEIDTFQSLIEEADDVIEDCDADIATLTQLKQLYLSYKTYLTNQAIGAIESKVNEYLKEVGTNLSLQLDGYSETATGKISERISATVLRNGIPEASYGRFSGGERMRIDIAVIVAMQRLINASSPTGGLDLLFLDEIVESGDSLAIEGTLKALQKTQQTIQLVTHGAFSDIYPITMMIEKTQDGYSVVAES